MNHLRLDKKNEWIKHRPNIFFRPKLIRKGPLSQKQGKSHTKKKATCKKKTHFIVHCTVQLFTNYAESQFESEMLYITCKLSESIIHFMYLFYFLSFENKEINLITAFMMLDVLYMPFRANSLSIFFSIPKFDIISISMSTGVQNHVK